MRNKENNEENIHFDIGSWEVKMKESDAVDQGNLNNRFT